MITRDLLLAEIVRAIRFHFPFPEIADEIVAHVERALQPHAAQSTTFPRRRVGKAIRSAFPERAALLLAALDRLVPKQSARAEIIRRSARRQARRAWRRERESYHSDFHGQDVPWSTD